MKLPVTHSFRLEGKRALVTGASSGIGLGCATALADAGADVVCAARGEDKLNEAVAEMRAAGWSTSALPLDQTDLGALARVFEGNAFDIVVNSAGILLQSWGRCSDAIGSMLRKDYTTCQSLPSPNCPIHPGLARAHSRMSSAIARAIDRAGDPRRADHADGSLFNETLEDDRVRLMRHGHLQERYLMTGIGPVPVNVPPVRSA